MKQDIRQSTHPALCCVLGCKCFRMNGQLVACSTATCNMRLTRDADKHCSASRCQSKTALCCVLDYKLHKLNTQLMLCSAATYMSLTVMQMHKKLDGSNMTVLLCCGSKSGLQRSLQQVVLPCSTGMHSVNCCKWRHKAIAVGDSLWQNSNLSKKNADKHLESLLLLSNSHQKPSIAYM